PKPKFKECYAELARLSASYSPSKGRLPTCYAPVRRAPPVLLQARTRLACVKHAASVRSEPGSNSRLKLVAWRKKMLLDLHRRASLPSELLSLDLLRPFVLEKDEWFRTDSGTSYRLSKSLSSLSCRKAHPQPKENTTGVPKCQQDINDFHRNPQAGIRNRPKAFSGSKLRDFGGLIYANRCWTYFGFETSLAAFMWRKTKIGSPPDYRIANPKASQIG